MVETIVAALIGGVTAATGKVATKAVEDAYAALKGLIVSKLGARSEAAETLAKLEAKPERDGYRQTLADALKDADAGQDGELLDAARNLQTALDALSPEDRTHVQNAVGKYIAQADRGSTATVHVTKR